MQSLQEIACNCTLTRLGGKVSGQYVVQWFHGLWPMSWCAYNITVLELYPIVAAVSVWGDRWENKSVCFYTDNQSLDAIFECTDIAGDESYDINPAFSVSMLMLQHKFYSMSYTR